MDEVKTKLENQLEQAFSTNWGKDLRTTLYKYALHNGIKTVSMKELLSMLGSNHLYWGGVDICSADEADNVPVIDKKLQEDFEEYKAKVLKYSKNELKIKRYFCNRK